MTDTHENRIMKLCDYIEDELHGSKKYLKLALKMKGTDKPTADMFFNMASAEYGHAENLLKMADTELKSAKDAGHEMEEKVRCVYEWQKEKHIEKMAEIKNLMAMYKGQ